jgi:hypothetical protein
MNENRISIMTDSCSDILLNLLERFHIYPLLLVSIQDPDLLV